MGVFDYLPDPSDVWSGATNGGLSNAWHNIEGALVTKTDTSPIQKSQQANLDLANSLAGERQNMAPTAAPQTGGFAVGNAPTSYAPYSAPSSFAPSSGGAAAKLSGVDPHATTDTVQTASWTARPTGQRPDFSKITPTGPTGGVAPTPTAAAGPQSATPGGPGSPSSAGGTTYVGNAAQASGTTINTLQADQTRQQQLDALSGLQAAATGAVPSAAEIQQRKGLDTAVASQFALANSLGSRSPGGALRTASRGAASIQQAGVNDAAALRATEEANARNTYASALQGVRGQDQDQAQAQAALTQSNNQFNTNATNTLQNKVLDANTQSQLANLNAQLTTMGLDEHQREALLSAQLQAMGYAQSGANALVQANTANAAAENQFKGGLISTGGQLLSALSDAREKTDVKDADMSDFLDKLSPYLFRYKDETKEGAGPGQRIGIMAQDAKRSKIGRSFTVEKDGRIQLDVGNALGAALAASADLNRRLKALEGR